MRESYGEDLASHSDLEPYADHGNVVGVASARGTGRPAIELRNQSSRVPTLWCPWEGNIIDGVFGEPPMGTAESQNLCMSGNSQRENREVPWALRVLGLACGRKTPLAVQPTCTPMGSQMIPYYLRSGRTKPEGAVAESVEERGSPEGNATQYVLLPDSVPDLGRYRREPLRQVEMPCILTVVPKFQFCTN